MRPAEQQSALEALTRTDGWALVREYLQGVIDTNTAKLRGITGPAGTAEAPVWAARARTAEQVMEWPAKQVDLIVRQLEQGEHHG